MAISPSRIPRREYNSRKPVSKAKIKQDKVMVKLNHHMTTEINTNEETTSHESRSIKMGFKGGY